MAKYRVIDADAHFIEPDDMWPKYLDRQFRPMAPRLVRDSRGKSCMMIGDALNPCDPFDFVDTPQARLNAMDAEGIDAAVIYPTVGLFFGGLDRLDFLSALCRAANDWASEYCGANPRRLAAPAIVPQLDIYEAVKEARRAVAELGLNGVFMRPNPIGGRNLDHPAWEPMWDLLEELDVPLVLHEGTSGNVPQVGPDRFDNALYAHAISHPAEHMMAMMTLICGGVLDRHPSLRVVHVEAGCGWVPYWLERLDHHVGYYWIPDGGSKPQLKPSEYFKRQVLVSADPEENMLAEVVSAIGDDNIGFSTDFPHPDHRFEGMVARCADRPELAEETKVKILGGNAARMFRI